MNFTKNSLPEMNEKQKAQRQEEFLAHLERSVLDESFVKLSLGNYQGEEPELKKILITQVALKDEMHYNCVYRYKTRDITKNYKLDEGSAKIKSWLINDFFIATLFTTEQDLILENIHNKKLTLRKKTNSRSKVQLKHNHQKDRPISPDTPYLIDLNISNKDGQVFKAAQDKYKQINHFIGLLQPSLKSWQKEIKLNVVDMGSGKGYLTFALYDFLTSKLKLDVEVKGMEMRTDLVDLCNRIAVKNKFNNLSFEKGHIQGADLGNIDMLLALHACDTATDDAIKKGIEGNATYIITAPCCHKQVRREMESSKKQNDVQFLTRHGIFMERQAEMVTDGIRTLVLEYFGYKVKVIEFISDAHTPKNVMIVAEKSERTKVENEDVMKQIRASMTYFGVERHHLVDALGV